MQRNNNKSPLSVESHSKPQAQQYTPNKNVFKVVTVGDSSVGKTHILHKYVSGQLPAVA